LESVNRLAKDRKVFRIWLMQPDAWRGSKEIEKEEKKSFGMLRHIYWLIWCNISEGLNFVVYPFSCWRNASFEKVRSDV
jgi:hypothetical protein